MKRRVLSFVMLLTIIASIFPVASAVSETITANGTCGESLTWVLYDDGELVIRGMGEMNNWSSDSMPWYSYRGDVKKVTIENGVKTIGNSAFNDCGNLASIAIPDTVTNIGYDAFCYCDNLKSVYISDIESWCNISFSEDYSFQVFSSNPLCNGGNLYINNIKAENITIPDTVTKINDYAFVNYNSLKSITIPVGVTSIGDCAFFGCSTLASIEIPDSVASIGKKAFAHCESLESIIIPKGITSINYFTFTECHSLKNIIIPNSVTLINDYAFSNCIALESITIANSITGIGESAFFYSPLQDIYYRGTKEDWNKINIGEYNDEITNATIHYNCMESISVSDLQVGTNAEFTLNLTSYNGYSGKILVMLYNDKEKNQMLSLTSYGAAESIPVSIPINNATKAKVMWWDMNSLIPYCEPEIINLN